MNTPDKEAIVFVHGLLGFSAYSILGKEIQYFRSLHAHLQNDPRQIFFPTLPPNSVIEVRAQALANFLARICADRIDLIAHSMGGLDSRYLIHHLDPMQCTPGAQFNHARYTASWLPAGHLFAGMDAHYLLADRGYDSNTIIEQAEKQGMKVVIPPKKNRKIQRSYDKELYKLRHLVENAFLHLKRWRGIATRYAKNTSSFLAAVQIRCIALWASVS